MIKKEFMQDFKRCVKRFDKEVFRKYNHSTILYFVKFVPIKEIWYSRKKGMQKVSRSFA
jgi:hypothetical protein